MPPFVAVQTNSTVAADRTIESSAHSGELRVYCLYNVPRAVSKRGISSQFGMTRMVLGSNTVGI